MNEGGRGKAKAYAMRTRVEEGADIPRYVRKILLSYFVFGNDIQYRLINHLL